MLYITSRVCWRSLGNDEGEGVGGKEGDREMWRCQGEGMISSSSSGGVAAETVVDGDPAACGLDPGGQGRSVPPTQPQITWG
jgi:hypothetical protein